MFILGKQLPLTIYSCKTQNVRSVNVEPSDSWGGQGLLGISIKFCSFEVAKENVWHILEVNPNSPASVAGLKPFSDYIIGSDTVLHESEDLFNLIESHDGVSLKFYVYNFEEDSCREVIITPNSHWGGEGLLGCGIGYGYLHRIPVRGKPTIPATTTIFSPSLISASTKPTTDLTANQNISNVVQNIAELSLNTSQTNNDKFEADPSSVIIPQENIDPLSSSKENVPAIESFASNISPPSALPPQFNANMVSQKQQLIAETTHNTTVPPIQQFVLQPQIQNPQIPLYMSTTNTTPFVQNPVQVTAPNYFPNNPLVVSTYSSNQQPPLNDFIQTNAAFNTFPNSSLPPPPLSGFQPSQPITSPIIFDPTIAAQSAQQLLSGNISHKS